MTRRISLQFLVLSCCFLFMDFKTVWANEDAGEVTKYDGKVLMFRSGEVRGSQVNKINTPIHVHDAVRTKRNSSCYIRFIDASKIVLKENSSLTIKGVDHANVDRGAVLFEIKKRGQVKGLNISSATITIGVKGTRFAVYKKDGKLAVFLKEGLLELVSDLGEFKKYGEDLKQDYEELSRKIKEDFEATRSKMAADFEASKQKMQEGNFQYLKTFEMTAGSAISIDENNEVWSVDIPAWVESDFALLETFDN